MSRRHVTVASDRLRRLSRDAQAQTTVEILRKMAAIVAANHDASIAKAANVAAQSASDLARSGHHDGLLLAEAVHILSGVLS